MGETYMSCPFYNNSDLNTSFYMEAYIVRYLSRKVLNNLKYWLNRIYSYVNTAQTLIRISFNFFYIFPNKN